MLGAWNVQADTVIAYTVVEGDEIDTIAGKYDVMVEDIVTTNGLETEEIHVRSLTHRTLVIYPFTWKKCEVTVSIGI